MCFSQVAPVSAPSPHPKSLSGWIMARGCTMLHHSVPGCAAPTAPCISRSERPVPARGVSEWADHGAAGRGRQEGRQEEPGTSPAAPGPRTGTTGHRQIRYQPLRWGSSQTIKKYFLGGSDITESGSVNLLIVVLRTGVWSAVTIHFFSFSVSALATHAHTQV